MPVATTYPGVYIQELPSGVHTITGVATSITAFVGRAASGPTDEAVEIESFADYQRQFGGLSLISPMSFAVRDYYLNGGNQAVIVRLYQPTFPDAATRDKAAKAAADTAAAAIGGTPADVVNAVKAKAATFPADPEKSAAAAVLAAATAAAGQPGATVKDVQAAATAAANKAASRSRAQINANGLVLWASSPGSWGNNLRARIDAQGKDPKLFNLSVRDGNTGNVETYLNLSIDAANPREVGLVLKNESTLVLLASAPGALPTPHDPPAPGKSVWDDIKDNTSPQTYSAVQDADRADDGGWLTTTNFTGTGKFDAKQGLYALRKTDLFNLLCIPPFQADGSIDYSIVDDAVAFCTARRAVMLIDPPPGWDTKKKALDGIASGVGSPTSYAAIYFPRLTQPNPLRNNQPDNFVPCGAVAGVFASTDAQRGVWKAPAGLNATLAGVPQLSVALTDPDNGDLNQVGINCLRSFPAAGRVVWGARTRRGDDRLADQWKYVPVRRTALYIEESLYRGTQWVVFEPNDEPLWAQIRLNIGAFMQGLFRQGAFQGATPAQAYLVKCDKETTTQNDIDKGVVNIIVGFAPLKPAEFVVIQIQQIAGQIQV
jgi:phage tail sheath protein FI